MEDVGQSGSNHFLSQLVMCESEGVFDTYPPSFALLGLLLSIRVIPPRIHSFSSSKNRALHCDSEGLE